MAAIQVSAHSPARQRLLLLLLRSLQAEQPDSLGYYAHLDSLTANDYRAALRAQRPVFKAKSLKSPTCRSGSNASRVKGKTKE